MTFNLHEMLFESESKPVSKQPVQPTPPAQSTQQYVSVPAGPVASDTDDSVYQRLKSKTDFNSDPVMVVINKYLSPLSSIPMDEKTKFKVALAQAQAQDKLPAQDILGVFERMSINLQTASESFVSMMVAATKNSVDDVMAKASSLTEQIKTMQEEAAKLTNDAFQAKQRLQTAQFKFDNALRTRQSEISQEREKFAGLMA